MFVRYNSTYKNKCLQQMFAIYGGIYDKQ